jgi:hypothetical protein
MSGDVMHRMREILVGLGVSAEVSMICEITLRNEFGGEAIWIGKRPKSHALQEIFRHPELGTAELAKLLGVTSRRVRQLKQLNKPS